jgi:hypothetical protein
MKASDFARWAGPRAANIEIAVTAVTAVTVEQKSSVSAKPRPHAGVTAAPKATVTMVTRIEADRAKVSASRPLNARSPKNPRDDLIGNSIDHCNYGEQSTAAGLSEEHAAPVKHGGNAPCAWVEGFARLDPARRLPGIPPKQWQAVIDAIGQFLDRWAGQAAALGWEAADIFGADADRPEVSWLNSGPLWCGDGARVVIVYADRIILETKGGATQTALRRPYLRPRVLPWDLVS